MLASMKKTFRGGWWLYEVDFSGGTATSSSAAVLPLGCFCLPSPSLSLSPQFPGPLGWAEADRSGVISIPSSDSLPSGMWYHCRAQRDSIWGLKQAQRSSPRESAGYKTGGHPEVRVGPDIANDSTPQYSVLLLSCWQSSPSPDQKCQRITFPDSFAAKGNPRT